jgi:hypothetical protein
MPTAARDTISTDANCSQGRHFELEETPEQSSKTETVRLNQPVDFVLLAYSPEFFLPSRELLSFDVGIGTGKQQFPEK